MTTADDETYAGAAAEEENEAGSVRMPKNVEARAKTNAAHAKVLRRVRERIASGQPIRVAILVSDASKWNAGSLAQALRADGRYRVDLVLTITGRERGKEATIASYLKERAFFERIEPDLVDMLNVETGELKMVESLDYDLVFLQQPWGMRDFPQRLVGRALTGYMHYGFLVINNPRQQYRMPKFHDYLWTYFSQSAAHEQHHHEENPTASDYTHVTGYPKLDVYLDPAPADDPIWKRPNGPNRVRRVLYAPHHSLGAKSLRMATFRWNWRLLQELARLRLDVDWVYKPHGKMGQEVVNKGIMTPEKFATYEAEWASMPNTSALSGGNYYDVFRTSDALITDSGSFLGEYLLTGKPIIWMISKQSVGLNPVMKKLSSVFYHANNPQQLTGLFRSVVVEGQDPLMAERHEMMKSLMPTGETSASRIVKYLNTQFGLN